MTLSDEQINQLMDTAQQAAKLSYSPFSHFPVGAALWLSDGKMISGTNVENASYGLTICAERVALFTAVSQGNIKQVQAMAVWAEKTPSHHITPCGACRQVMHELLKPSTPVYYLDSQGLIQHKVISEWLPETFSLS